MQCGTRDSFREEEEIFSTLLAVVKHHDLPVTLRVAGGWVRDKLLGKQSSDIDIALDSMLGREFAEQAGVSSLRHYVFTH